MPETATEQDEPDGASVLSKFLMSLINTRIQQGVAAAGASPSYCVIRSETTGVLSVLATCTLGGDQKPAKGPASFADCIAFVNAKMVVRQAVDAPPSASEEPQ